MYISRWLSIATEQGYAAVAVFDLWLVCYFCYYVFREVKSNKNISLLYPRSMPQALQAAIAILVFHVGDFGVRSIFWYWHHLNNNNPDGAPPVNLDAIILGLPMMGFLLIVALGIFCQLRVFSRPWLGNVIWITGGIAAVSAALLVRLLP